MSGQDQDFVWVEDPDSPNNGPKVNTAVWCLFGLATIFLALRVFCKFKRHRGLWWDDHVLIASWLAFLVGAIQLSINIAHGFGKPGLNINPAHSYQVGLGGLVVGTMVMVAPIWSKTSFVLTLTRISGPKLTIALWVIAISMNIFQAVAIIVQWVQCTPLEKVWTPWMPEGSCWPYQVNLGMSMFSAAYSGFMDLVLAAIPWIILKDLQIKKREKLGIAVAMSMGIVAAATAFVKCAKLKILASSDFTLEGGELIIWAATEISTTIVAASIPVLRTLVREISTARGGPSGGGYFRSGTENDNDNRTPKSRGIRPGTNVAVVSSLGHHHSRNGGVSPDAASDKSILEAVQGKIVKTEEVDISVKEMMGYEMQGMQGMNDTNRHDEGGHGRAY